MTDERRRAEDHAERLKAIFGEELVAVLLYGSAARGEYRPGRSDLNLLVITRTLGIDELRRASAAAREWVAQGNPPPMMLSESEWQRSADVFAMEYTDIREAHILLAGRDPFAGMRILREHLRLQVEHEFRSKKIQLREGYLAAGNSPQELGRLMTVSLSTFLALFRALLRLDGRDVPRTTPALIEAAAAHVDFAPAPLLEVLQARDRPDGIAASIDSPLAAAYLEVVERSVAWLDSYRTHGGFPEVL